jgi:hypothetical protein
MLRVTQEQHWSTRWKVVGSIPDIVTGILQWYNTSGRTMVPGSTQPLTERVTGTLLVYKSGRCVQLTTLPSFVPTVYKSGSLDLLETSGPAIGLHRDFFTCIYVLQLTY